MAAGTPTAESTRESLAPQSDVEIARSGRLWVEMRSPDGPIFSGWAQSVTVPGSKGSMGILPRHAPLMSSLDVGLTRVVVEGGREHRFVTGAGFVEVNANKVLLLVDFGDPTEGIDLERAQQARDRAQARLRTRGENFDAVRAEAALQRALQRLRYAGAPRI